MGRGVLRVLFFVLCFTASALRYDPAYVQYNLNENKTATNPIDYWGEWKGHEYTPSPSNWRFPFYTLFLDRFVNGDPTNDNINATVFEHDPNSNQMRHGGDLQGLVDTLDYLQGMGVKVSHPESQALTAQPKRSLSTISSQNMQYTC
jgi:alpha-1,3-glucan synthase